MTDQEANAILESKYGITQDVKPNLNIAINKYVVVPRSMVMNLVDAYCKVMVANMVLRTKVTVANSEKCIRPDMPCIHRNGRS